MVEKATHIPEYIPEYMPDYNFKATYIPDYNLSDSACVRALSNGTATDTQQRQAFDFIINNLCQTYKLVYEQGSFDATAFRAGKAFVGQVLIGMTKPETYKKLTNQG